jgi:RimJ/RimL family protein N-acetyltransferase
MLAGAGQSERLAILRAWSAEDASWYIAQLDDPAIQRFTTERADTTVEAFHAALDDLQRRADLAGFAIVDARTGSLAGNLAAALKGGTAEIHYWIAPDYRGRGIAPDAVSQMCQWIAANWTMCGLVALNIDADNLSSQRVAEKAGFEWRRDQDGLNDTTQRVRRWYIRQLR